MEDHQPSSESFPTTVSCTRAPDSSNLGKVGNNDVVEAEEAVDFGCSVGDHEEMNESQSMLDDADNMAVSQLPATLPVTSVVSCTTASHAAPVCSQVHEGIDRLLVRHRNEIMFELRRLQFGDRPVTGDTGTVRRQAVDRLVSRFARQTSVSTSQLATTQQDQLESERSARPEQVIVEVNALVEQRPVSSILQSAAFRSSIERSLRGALTSLRRDHGAVDPMVAFARQQRIAAAAAAAASAAAASSSSPSVAERVAESDRLSSGTSSVSGDMPQGLPANQTEMGPDRTAAWLQQNPLNVPPQSNEQSQAAMIEVIEHMQHDNVLSEISELIQAQLVTSALDGPIREVLEQQMRNRLEESGIDGARVQQLLNRLPRNHQHRRNDFRELGAIGAGQGQQNDNVDSISVISATAAVALPQSYSQSTMALSHDVRALQTQVTELKTMLQLSFDLQLDIQRAIRQEVAAAVSASLASAVGGGTSTAMFNGVMNGSRSSRPPSGSCGNCLICLDKPVDTVLYQCGHMCLCYTCGMLLRQRSTHAQCPVCRAPIRDVIRAYHN